MSRSRLWLVALLLAGCSNSHLVGTTQSPGYLSNDPCTGHTDQAACVADGTNACTWIAPACPAGVPCPSGVCYQPDPCLKLNDATSCNANPACAWSLVGTLCPLGASCGGAGYCHPKDSSGGGCGCVTPIACPAGVNCPPPECDCNGGGGSGGGTCTCSAPACAPGQPCPPAICDCGPGGGTGGGCVDNGTCTCSCPACAPGQTCPPCGCSCGSGGPVPAPDPATGTAGSSGGGSAPNGGTGGGNGGTGGGSTDPCSVHSDGSSCSGDAANKCQWYALGIPCASGDPSCPAGVCQQAPPPPPSGGGCACGCPSCAPNQPCPPCQCTCGTDPTGGCTPPPLPPSGGSGGGSGGGGVACPAIGCAPQCPNGYKTDANGCPSCTCA